MEENILALRGQLDQLQRAQVDGSDELSVLQAELIELKNLAGLTEITGPGVTVVLDDNRSGAEAARLLPDYNPENFIIHDKDIRWLVNDAKRGGAEAIAINGHRLVNISEIRCVGPVIFINSTRMAPPYVVKIIGDPDTLEQLISTGDAFPILKWEDFPVKLTKEASITIPAYKGSLPLNYIKPIDGDSSRR